MTNTKSQDDDEMPQKTPETAGIRYLRSEDLSSEIRAKYKEWTEEIITDYNGHPVYSYFHPGGNWMESYSRDHEGRWCVCKMNPNQIVNLRIKK